MGLGAGRAVGCWGIAWKRENPGESHRPRVLMPDETACLPFSALALDMGVKNADSKRMGIFESRAESTGDAEARFKVFRGKKVEWVFPLSEPGLSFPFLLLCLCHDSTVTSTEYYP